MGGIFFNDTILALVIKLGIWDFKKASKKIIIARRIRIASNKKNLSIAQF